MEVDLKNLSAYTDEAIKLALAYGPKLVLAILTLIVGLWVIKWFSKGMIKVMDSRRLDPSLKPFFSSLISITLKILLAISVMGMIGIEMTSFIALLGAAGLAFGMALSGTLQNFAGGVVLLVFKPFKVGDFVEAAGYSGTVSEIRIFNTILKTPDNKTIIIPNNAIAGSSMVNYTTEATRRVDFVFGISYQDDIDLTKSILNRLIERDERIHKDPAPFIGLTEMADSSVNLVVRVWADTPNYWPIYFDMMEDVKKTFDAEGISIPFPQRDVHLYNQKA
ncbi:MAG TPA: mechanosensitive ion channel domain-containing protein [Cyclobacteriaceae bacterium]|jgi:small conductance mechanosensitive channel